jgi:hypothetical protein
MKFPRFWAQGRAGDFSVWRWSDRNEDEAKTAAQQAAQLLAAQFEKNDLPDQRYGYGNRPLREPVLREMRNEAGELVHAITRNSYGCQVMNSAAGLFVDVDLPAQKPTITGLFGSLFGKKAAAPEGPVKASVAKAAAWAQSHPGWNWRIYRTKAGVRLLATHALFDPDDPVCEQVFEAMGADPLYRKLCQTQECFRARLTPKYWRCKPTVVGKPPARWPFENQHEEAAFTNWETKYKAACQTKATCLLLDKGSGEIHPGLREMVAVHDEVTRAEWPGIELA